MGIFSIFKKRSRVDLIDMAASKAVSNIVDDLNNFTEIEQAKIVKRVNTVFLQRFTDGYDEAHQQQQNILTAKDLLK